MTDPPAIPANPDKERPATLTNAALAPDSPQQVMHDYLAFFSGRIVVLAVLALTVVFSLLTFLVLRADLLPTSWDINVTHEIQEFPYMPVGAILVAVSEPGFQPWNWLLVSAVVLSALFIFRRPIEALFIALAGAGGLFVELFKNIIDRPRPTPEFVTVTGHLQSYSFPSGHVTTYTIVFGFLFYLTYVHIHKRAPLRTFLLAFCALMILLVGPSRVYMGQHWASDALAGYALGFAYLLLLIELYRYVMKRKTKAQNEAGET
jgi:membrane-associated phospholipid phosphatase